MESFLVLRLSAMGDVLFALAVVERLKSARPESRIAFAVEDRFAAIPRAHRDVDEVIVFPRREGIGAMARSLRAFGERRFDVAFDLQGNARSAMHFSRLHGAKLGGTRRIGFARPEARELSWMFTDERVTPPANARHRVDRFLSLLGPLGVLAHREAPARLIVDDATRARVDAAFGVDDRMLVLLHPGTSAFGAFKRWEPARFGALARGLSANESVRCVVTGGPGEEALVAEAVAASGGAATAAPAFANLIELAEALGRADLVVAADTGPLHLANRMGAPVLGLFGPKDPARYGPAYAPSEVVRRDDVPCSPCTRRWCEAPACMTAIAVEPVLAAAKKLLEERRASLASAGRARFKGC